MKIQQMFIVASLLCCSVSCMKNNNNSAVNAIDAASSPTADFSSLQWHNDYPGKSSSYTRIDVQKSGDNLVIKLTDDWTNYPIESGVTIRTLDTAKKIATAKIGRQSLSTYDGSSSDPAQLKGYYDVIENLSSNLRCNVSNPGDEQKAKRDVIVALLDKLLPSAAK